MVFKRHTNSCPTLEGRRAGKSSKRAQVELYEKTFCEETSPQIRHQKAHLAQNGGGFKFQHVVWRGLLDVGYVALCSSKR